MRSRTESIACQSSVKPEYCEDARLDEVSIDLVPVLLGNGVPLFEHFEAPILLDGGAAHHSASGGCAREGSALEPILVGTSSSTVNVSQGGYWSYWPVIKKGLALQRGLTGKHRKRRLAL